MATEILDVGPKQVLGDEEIQLLVDAPAEETENLVRAALPGKYLSDELSSFPIGMQTLVSVGGAGGPPSTRVMSLGAGSPGYGYAQGRILTYEAADDGMALVPFDDSSGDTFWVGIAPADAPSEVTVCTDGTYRYSRYRRTNGRIYTPSGVTVNPGGAGSGLRLTITSAYMPAWDNGALTRPALAYLVTPVSAGVDALTVGTISIVGGATVFDTGAGNYLGQTEAGASAVAADYRVFVPGLTITKTDLTADVSGGALTHLVVDSWDETGAASYTAPVVLTLQDVSRMALEGFFNYLLLRAGCNLGTYTATREWNDEAGGNVVIDSGVDPVTFTFNTPFAGAGDIFIFTGSMTDLIMRCCTGAVTGGLVPTLSKAEASGQYHVIAEFAEVTWPVFGKNKFRLSIVSDADWTFVDLSRYVLHIAEFTFTTGTGVVTNWTPDDLSLRRGIADGYLISGGSRTGSTDGWLNASDLMARDNGADASALVVYARDATGTTFTRVALVSANRNLTTKKNSISVLPIGGGSLDAGEWASVYLGGALDYGIQARNTGGVRTLEIEDGVAGISVVKHARAGGNAVDSLGRLLVEDLHLVGANGKLIWNVQDLESGKGHPTGGADWIYQSTGEWKNTNAASIDSVSWGYRFSVEPGGAGKLIQARVYCRMTNAQAGDTLALVLYKYVPSTRTLTSIATGSLQGVGGVGANIEGWVTLNPADTALTQDIRFIVAAGVSANVSATAYEVHAVEWQRSVFEITSA